MKPLSHSIKCSRLFFDDIALVIFFFLPPAMVVLHPLQLRERSDVVTCLDTTAPSRGHHHRLPALTLVEVAATACLRVVALLGWGHSRPLRAP